MGQLSSPIGTAHLMALGKITANFSQLEDELCRLIWYLVGPDEQLGQVVTAELPFRSLVNLAGALVRHRTSDPRTLEEVEAALKSAIKAEQERNTMVHSTWFSHHTDDEVSRTKLTAKREYGRKVQFEMVTPEAIEQVATHIAEATFSVMQIYAKMQHGALPLTPPPGGAA
jgi:hypothetical protein